MRSICDALKEGGPGRVVHERDLALAERAAAGERLAATAVLRRLLPQTGQAARALATQAGGSDEARTAAVHRILHNLRAYDGEQPLESWARQLTSPLVLRISHDRDSGGSDGAASAGSSTTPIEPLTQPLSSYLSALGEPRRSVLVLRHTLGHSLAEISELCDVPEATITSFLKAGHERLRRILRGELGGAGTPPSRRTREGSLRDHAPDPLADERWQCLLDAHACGESLSDDEEGFLRGYRGYSAEVVAERALWLAVEQLGKSDDDLRLLDTTLDSFVDSGASVVSQVGRRRRNWGSLVAGVALLAAVSLGWLVLRVASEVISDIASEEASEETAAPPDPPEASAKPEPPAAPGETIVRSGSLGPVDGEALSPGELLPMGVPLRVVEVPACIAQADAVVCFNSGALLALPTVEQPGWVQPLRGRATVELPASSRAAIVVGGAHYRGGPEGARAVVDMSPETWTVEVEEGALLPEVGAAIKAGDSATGSRGSAAPQR